MPVFQDAEHFYRVVGEFMKIPSRPRTIQELRQWWGHSPAYYENGDEVDQMNQIGEKIRKSRIAIEFEITQPNALICIDARQPKKGEIIRFTLVNRSNHWMYPSKQREI